MGAQLLPRAYSPCHYGCGRLRAASTEEHLCALEGPVRACVDDGLRLRVV